MFPRLPRAPGQPVVSDAHMNHSDLDLSFSIPLSRSFSGLSARRRDNQFYHNGVRSRGGRHRLRGGEERVSVRVGV